MRAVTDGRFKLLKYDVGNDGVQVTQLFDLQTNPFELLPEHGVPNIAIHPAYACIRQGLEEKLTAQQIENADPFKFLGDRTVLLFENSLQDRLPFANDGTAASGNGGTLLGFKTDVPNTTDYVFAEGQIPARSTSSAVRKTMFRSPTPRRSISVAPHSRSRPG